MAWTAPEITSGQSIERKQLCDPACRLAHARGAGVGHQKPEGDGQAPWHGAEQVRHIPFSGRLAAITKWTMENTEESSGLPIGYFGSSTGAAAAIEASAAAADGYTDQGNTIADRVYAIVSRGGRPDLANPEATKNVRAATLLVVGARDASVVIELNRKTLKKKQNKRPRNQ